MVDCEDRQRGNNKSSGPESCLNESFGSVQCVDSCRDGIDVRARYWWLLSPTIIILSGVSNKEYAAFVVIHMWGKIKMNIE